MQVWHEIPVDLISNFDQTPFPYIRTGNYRYAKKQSSNVPLVKKGKKKFQLLGLDHFFPLSLSIKERPIDAFQKRVDFPADFDATCTANRSSNESKAIQHLGKIVFPFFEKKKEIRPLDQKAIFQFDVFEEHFIEKVAFIIEENNSVIIYVSNHLTHQFQPLELNVRS